MIVWYVRICLSAFICALFLACGASAQQAPVRPAGFTFEEAEGKYLYLREGGALVLTYNFGMILKPGVPEDRRRCCYVHPLYAPGGTVVTDDFPGDHLHHRGIFWTWPVVRVDGETYDQWLIKGAQDRFVRWIEKTVDSHSARLAVENGWFAGDRRLLKETVAIEIQPEKGGSRKLDFQLILEALDKPVEIEGTAEGNKGYGGFSVRFAPREETVITTDAGQEQKDTDMVPHRWAELTGQFQGKPAALRIDIDPGNPGAPNGWCLRHYGFLGVNFPGRAPFRIIPGKPLSLKYAVTISGR
jgi:hypothetical protein